MELTSLALENRVDKASYFSPATGSFESIIAFNYQFFIGNSQLFGKMSFSRIC
ncbi:hypothetical protein HDF18_13865 [Mucilaginibacter sp. X5P1]|uniref:hypothetical protein n=1 Tax=Mucilaginibacter sp. X5P1 TaxID=2723088 RepID=UPI0016111C5D|nr:hypothetical protein [Mucilaginibacter sp. X5P1]MBB6138685.1 hypothetical protein [Mucilaginibacter sp. X5P1]